MEPTPAAASREYLVLFSAPSLREDLETHVQRVAEIVSMPAVDVRHRLAKPGVTYLAGDGGGSSPQALKDRAHRLRQAGYPAQVIRERVLRDLPLPRRTTGLRIEPDTLGFTGREGAELLRVDGKSRVLAVVGDLASGAEASAITGRLRSPARRLLRTGQGEPILRIFLQGAPDSLVLYGRRFNYTTLGDRAGVSAGVNFRNILALLEERAGSLDLDLEHGLGDLPPVSLPRFSSAGERAESFEVHARTTFLLWQEGHIEIGGTAQATTGSSASSRAAGPPTVSEAEARIMAEPERHPGPWGRLRRRLAFFGPVPVVAPLAAASLVGLAGGLAVPVLFSPGVGCAGLLCLVHSYESWRRKRQIEDHPTSRIRSLAMGRVEVVGRARQRIPLKTPFSLVDCVYYRAEIRRLVRGGQGGGHWKRVHAFSSGEIPFYVEDDTGRVLVDPVDATFDLETRRVHEGAPLSVRQIPGLPSLSGHDRTRYIEEYVPAGLTVYVLGTARPHRPTRDRGQTDLTMRLREIKRDPQRMARFDADGDGRVDEGEWERAVQQVEREVLEEKLRCDERGDPVVLGRSGTGGLFLISDHDERGLLQRLVIRSWGGLVLGAFLLGLAVWGLFEAL